MKGDHVAQGYPVTVAGMETERVSLKSLRKLEKTPVLEKVLFHPG